MSSDEAPLTSKAELSAELEALFFRAYENGIDVKGGFECQNGAEYPVFDVVVTEVEKNEHSE